MKKDIIYFQHDSNARRDPKITALVADYGFEGYGRFWAIIEFLREQEGFIPRDKNSMRALAYELRMDTKDTEKFIDDLINEYELLRIDDEEIYSKRLNDSIEHLEEIREKRKNAINLRWKKNKKDAENTNVQETNTNVSEVDTKEPENHTKNRIEQNRIEKDSIVNINTTSVSAAPRESSKTQTDEDQDTFIRNLFISTFSRNPNLSDLQTTENFLKEFPREKVKHAFYKARECLGDKISLAWIRGALYETGTKKNNNGDNDNGFNGNRGSVTARTNYRFDGERFNKRAEMLEGIERSRSG